MAKAGNLHAPGQFGDAADVIAVSVGDHDAAQVREGKTTRLHLARDDELPADLGKRGLLLRR